MSNKNTIIVAIIAIVAIGFLVSEFGQVADLTGDVKWRPSRTSTPTYTPPPTSCTDSDGGINFFTPGTVTYGTSTSNDRCKYDYVIEGYCMGNYPGYQRFLCTDGCVTTGGIGHCAAAPPAPTPEPRNITA